MKVDERYLSLFWHWIFEREAVRLRKEAGEKHPWSIDQIFNLYHFCNVRREDDRGTKELRAVVTANAEVSELPVAYTLARMFNYAPTVEIALTQGMEAVKNHRDTGAKIFHPAYVVSTCGLSMDKVDFVHDVVRHVAKLKVPTIGLSAAHEELMRVNGLGSFMAAQVVADLRNDRYLRPASEYEAKFWSSWGPGSKKGLDIIFGPGTTPSSYWSRIKAVFELMPVEIAAMDIHAQDLQNCLCEFSKYIRHLDGLGGRVRYYHGK